MHCVVQMGDIVDGNASQEKTSVPPRPPTRTCAASSENALVRTAGTYAGFSLGPAGAPPSRRGRPSPPWWDGAAAGRARGERHEACC